MNVLWEATRRNSLLSQLAQGPKSFGRPSGLDIDEFQFIEFLVENGRNGITGPPVNDRNSILRSAHKTISSAFFCAFSSSKTSLSPAANLASIIW